MRVSRETCTLVVLSSLMSIFEPAGGTGEGGAGIRRVARLPKPTKGSVVYDKEDYLGPGPWESADFDLTITPQSVVSGGHPSFGYSDSTQTVVGNNYIEAGSISPLPPGLKALLIQGNGASGSGAPGTFYAKFEGELLQKLGRRKYYSYIQ